jgi:hypothetical protein
MSTAIIEQSYCLKTNTLTFTHYVDDGKYKWLSECALRIPQDEYDGHGPSEIANWSRLCHEKYVMRFTQWNPTRAAWIVACLCGH